jgi:hypothetical protein
VQISQFTFFSFVWKLAPCPSHAIRFRIDDKVKSGRATKHERRMTKLIGAVMPFFCAFVF